MTPRSEKANKKEKPQKGRRRGRREVETLSVLRPQEPLET
jgi:hypothetical protein